MDSHRFPLVAVRPCPSSHRIPLVAERPCPSSVQEWAHTRYFGQAIAYSTRRRRPSRKSCAGFAEGRGEGDVRSFSTSLRLAPFHLLNHAPRIAVVGATYEIQMSQSQELNINSWSSPAAQSHIRGSVKRAHRIHIIQHPSLVNPYLSLTSFP